MRGEGTRRCWSCRLSGRLAGDDMGRYREFDSHRNASRYASGRLSPTTPRASGVEAQTTHRGK